MKFIKVDSLMVGCSCLISCGRISSGVSTVDRFFDRNGGAIEQEKKGKMKKTKNKKQKKNKFPGR